MKKLDRKKYITVISVIIIYAFLMLCNCSYAQNNTVQTSNSNGNTSKSNTAQTSNSNTSKNNTTQTSESNSKTKSSNANLSDLGIKPNDFSGFKSSNTTYDVTVPKDLEEVEVYAKTQDTNAKVEGTGTKKLESGLNVLSVTVVAEDGTKKIYIINVTRGENEDTTTTQKNPNGTVDGLSKLEIANVSLDPKFSTDVYEYTGKYIGEDTKLDIQTETTDSYFTVEITGNNNLNEGENLITILVSDPDGKNVATYQVTITKSLVDEESLAKEQDEAKEKQKKMIIAGGIIAVIVIIIIFIVIRRKRDNEFAREYTVPYYGRNDDDEDEENYYDEETENYEENIENSNNTKDEELSKEEIKKKFLDNYNSYDYEDEVVEEKPKRKRHKGKRFK